MSKVKRTKQKSPEYVVEYYCRLVSDWIPSGNREVELSYTNKKEAEAVAKRQQKNSLAGLTYRVRKVQ